MKDFSYGEHPGMFTELRPKRLPNVLDRIQTQTINPIRLHQLTNPEVQSIVYFRHFCVQVWERNAVFLPNPELLDLSLIWWIISDIESWRMEVSRFIPRNEVLILDCRSWS